jgi:hypothetical protein
VTGWVGIVQASLAALGGAVFAWEALARRRAAVSSPTRAAPGTRAPGRHRRETDRAADGGRARRRGLLLVLAGLASLGGWNFLTFRNGQYLHAWDIYHHYMGSKYFRELGYLRLYECAAAADLEDGAVPDPSLLMYRSLSTNRIESGAPIVEDPGLCTRHFTRERWLAFKKDIGWFRDALGPTLWEQAQFDHGYNASPVWTLIGGTLAALVPATQGGILFLSLLDPLLIAAMWASVGWAFGIEPLCLSLLYWGTNYPGAFDWMGGAFLRQDWLALTILALALVRRGRPLLGGAALAAASLLRLAPVVAGVGLLAWTIAAAARRRPGALASTGRVALGGLAAAAILLPAAALAGGDAAAWRDFHGRLQLQRQSPAAINLGLETLLGRDRTTRLEVTADKTARYPIQRWEEEQQRVRQSRAGIVRIVALLCLAPLLVAAARAGEEWVALALGIGAIPIVFDLPCYYESVLLGLCLIVARRPAWGAAFCGLSLFTRVAPVVWSWYDDIFFWSSAGVVTFVVALAVAWGLWPRRDP